jgi:hypothetical protein
LARAGFECDQFERGFAVQKIGVLAQQSRLQVS